MNDDYSNRELDLKFERVHEKLDTIVEQNTVMDGKVTYTNGKVRKIIIALVLLAGVVIGQSFGSTRDIIELVAGIIH